MPANITCNNCGKMFAFNPPAKPGKYCVTCSKCKSKQYFEITPEGECKTIAMPKRFSKSGSQPQRPAPQAAQPAAQPQRPAAQPAPQPAAQPQRPVAQPAPQPAAQPQRPAPKAAQPQHPAQPAPQPAAQPQRPAAQPAAQPQQGVQPQRPGQQRLPVIGEFEVMKDHKVACPFCKQEILVRLNKKGPAAVECKHCGKKYAAVGTASKTVIFGDMGMFNCDTRRGIIRVRRKGLIHFGSSQQMMLRPGSTFIGRHDVSAPSDFSLSDMAVSRRSVEIFTELDPVQGFTFKLTVHKAANTVFHNGHPLAVGNSLGLKFGDTIQLGKTVLEFIPEHE